MPVGAVVVKTEYYQAGVMEAGVMEELIRVRLLLQEVRILVVVEAGVDIQYPAAPEAPA
jgi:hypothetical protein